MKRVALGLMFCTMTASAAEVFTLSSPDFSDNALLDKKFAGNAEGKPACTGEGISPALSWSNPPAGTKSYALTLVDTVGAKGIGVNHMVAYNIPAQRSMFARGELTKGKDYTGGKNTPGTLHYYGPCPPSGSGAHHYIFTLIATDLAPDALPQGLTREELIGKLKGHALGAAGLVGRFGND
ncbi:MULTISPECIES: YbhB/YbcL family Raf kinase inhibitor-like protein [Erwinia]|uniref:YbhB/YbcL family Raf kinase inhibitor-like protein n=1 Tax=Erwinia TaxID=551 RepID=UPI00055698BB|nr:MULTISPECIES: YbhB/YbcL family Raf kinase inhibitor-like protein [Erwinia]